MSGNDKAELATEKLQVLWTDLAISDDDEAVETTRSWSTERNRVPAVGTRIQRSSHVQARKALWLTEPPPPPPARRAQRKETKRLEAIGRQQPPTMPKGQTPKAPAAITTQAPQADQPPPMRPIGPTPPPPITVELEPGHTAQIPHFAVHVSRRYRVRTAEGQWMLRFTTRGELRSCRRVVGSKGRG